MTAVAEALRDHWDVPSGAFFGNVMKIIHEEE